MTDDLEKYVEIARKIQEGWSGPHPWAVSIDELIAMVRAERGHGACGWEAYEAKWLNTVEWKDRAESAEEKVKKLRKALEEAEVPLDECADDLESYVKSEYNWPNTHIAMDKKFNRDMDPVYKARAALVTIRALKGE